MEQPAFNEIRNLMCVIFGAIFAGIVVACFMIYYYGPTGHYEAQNVLINPFQASTLTFSDFNLQTNRLEKFVLEGIEFNYYDHANSQWIKTAVSKENYSEFYNLIAKESSLHEVPEVIYRQFFKPYPATLSFQVHAENTPSVSKIFLEANFVNEGDYYRVQLRNDVGATNPWAYFYHPGIYQKVMQLFAKKP